MNKNEFDEKLVKSISKLKKETQALTRDSELANDLVQETLLKALNKRCSYKADKNISGWLYTIMRNTYVNNYNIQQRYSSREIEERNEILTTSNDIVYDYNRLIKLIDSLPKEHSISFKMYVEGYKYHEISEKLSIPIGTVKSRIHIVRRKLKEMLE